VVATVGRARARSWIECVVGYLRDQGNRSCRSNGLAVLASSKGGGSGIRASPAESKSGPCRPSVSVVVCPSFSVRSLADRRGQCSTKKKIQALPQTRGRTRFSCASLSILKTRKPNTNKKRLSTPPTKFQSDFSIDDYMAQGSLYQLGSAHSIKSS